MKETKLINAGLLSFLLLLNTALIAQQQISGTVTDSNGERMIGVTIVEEGTSNGVITDENGNFQLVVQPNASLRFSYVGFAPQSIPVGDRQTIDVVMQGDGFSLDEVVVVGYGTQKKINLTGSVATIQAQDLVEVPASNTTQLLAGRVPGLLTKQGSSLPGSDGTTLNIRGFGNPLVLVDGIQMGLGAIDPNDIESISVLKDAAAAVYGARAGNGVILVKTKRGSGGRPSIAYHGNYTVQEATAFPDRVNAGKWAEIYREAQLNQGLDPRFTAEEVQKYHEATEPGFRSYDWGDELIDNFAPMQQHNLSVSGAAGDRVKYFTSLGKTSQESIISSRDYDYTRYNVRSNIDVTVTDHIGFALDLAYRKEEVSRPEESMNEVWNQLTTAHPIYNPHLPDGRVAYSGFSQRNPLARTTKEIWGSWDRSEEFFTGRLEGYYELPFVEGLRLKGVVNVISSNQFTKTLRKPFDLYEYDEVNDQYIWRAAAGTSITLTEAYQRESQLYPILSLEYANTFGGHTVSGLLLAESIESFSNSFSAFRRDLISAQVPQLFAGGDANVDNNGSAFEEGRKSYVGRANYSYKGKYLFEATFRYDANVQFAPDTRWGFFPSVSAAWRLSEEEFFSSNWLNNLKLRASYSQLGNDRFASGFDYLTGYAIQNTQGHLIGSIIDRQIRSLGLANLDLTWETMTIYNVGINAALWQGRLELEADVFYRKREDMLTIPTENLPSTFGANLPLTNLNSQEATGFELFLNYQAQVGNFKFNISPNLTYSRSKWIHFEEEVYDDPDEQRIFKRSGQWVNRRVGYLSDGLLMDRSEIENLDFDQDQNGNSTLYPGDIRYIDLNGDGVLDFRDQTEIGLGDFPDLVYGMNLGASFKGLYLNVLLQGASQYTINISGDARVTIGNETIPQEYHYQYRWKPDPDNLDVNINPDVKLPAASINIHANNNLNSDFWLIDGTYMRIKNVNLSYRLPRNLMSWAKISGLEIYVAASNLYTFSKLGFYKDVFDPEGPQNKAGRNYPIHRNYTAGVRLTL